MMAIILAGGKGTRLHPLTLSIPKPLMPLGETPIAEIVIRQLAASGFSKVVLSLNHMAPFFEPFLERWRGFGVEILCSQETEPLGTAAPISLIRDLEESFLVMNGDVLTTLDYRALFERHRTMRTAATIAACKRELRVDYGVVRSTADGLLEAYEEKPLLSYHVSMGINMFSRSVLDFIEPGRRLDIPDLLTALIGAGRTVACYEADCYWQDIGRLEDYEKATRDFQADSQRFMPVKGTCLGS